MFCAMEALVKQASQRKVPWTEKEWRDHRRKFENLQSKGDACLWEDAAGLFWCGFCDLQILRMIKSQENAEKCIESFCQVIVRSKELADCKGIEIILLYAYLFRGQAHYLDVDFKKAVQDYSKAIEIQESLKATVYPENFFLPTFPNVHWRALSYFNRGQIEYRVSHWEKAKQDLCRALEIDSAFTEAKIHLDLTQQQIDRNTPQENFLYTSSQ